jgi:uncharacterized protein YndB with AHSA1/START domain
MSETVMLDVELKSPIERVWRALTDPAQLSKWMMFEASDFKPVVGHRFQFRTAAMGGWNGIIDCEVLQVEAPRRLSYTWVGGPQAMQVDTTVVWTLTEGEGGTRLHLEQSGFPSELKQAIGGARYGWTRMLEQLQNLLDAA